MSYDNGLFSNVIYIKTESKANRKLIPYILSGSGVWRYLDIHMKH